MNTTSSFPVFEIHIPALDRFIHQLVNEYKAGKIKSWDDLDRRVKTFFTPERMDHTGSIVPRWHKMASYLDGVTLVHVMCVFMGLYMMPEFPGMMREQQQIMKWVILFHDIEKEPEPGKRDYVHAFRSAVTTAMILSGLGFPVANEFKSIINPWSEYTASAITESMTRPGEQISDNRKLPDIIGGIEAMYGKNTSAVLIVKGVLLHMSINVVKEWPQPAPLTDDEIAKYVDEELLPLLKVMHLADNEGWSMFSPEIRALQRKETLVAFQRVEEIIRRQGGKG